MLVFNCWGQRSSTLFTINRSTCLSHSLCISSSHLFDSIPTTTTTTTWNRKPQNATCKRQIRRTDGSFGGSVRETRCLPGGFVCFHVGSVMDAVLQEEVAQTNVKTNKVRCGGFGLCSQTQGRKFHYSNNQRKETTTKTEGQSKQQWRFEARTGWLNVSRCEQTGRTLRLWNKRDGFDCKLLFVCRLTLTAWQRLAWQFTDSCLSFATTLTDCPYPKKKTKQKNPQNSELSRYLYIEDVKKKKRTFFCLEVSRLHDLTPTDVAMCLVGRLVGGWEDREKGVKEEKQTADVTQAGGPSQPRQPIQMIYHPSPCLSVHRPACLSACLSISLPACLSASLFVCFHRQAALRVHCPALMLCTVDAFSSDQWMFIFNILMLGILIIIQDGEFRYGQNTGALAVF